MKHFFNFRKSKLLLFSLFAMLAGGASPAWADTLTEDFESLTVDGTTLSNGWFVQGTNGYGETYLLNSSLITNFSDAYNYSYELCKQGKSGCSIVTSKASNPAYIVIPVELTGTVTFYAASYKTSNGGCNVFEVTEDGGVYTIGTTSLTGGAVTLPKKSSSSASPSWNKIEVNLGSDHKMIAITMTYGALDDFEAEKYVFTPYEAPATITATSSSTTAEIAWAAGKTDETLTGWNLEYKKSADNTWTIIHNLDASTLSYSLDGLEGNTSYDVRISALYGENESSWKTTTFKTLRAPISAFPWTENFTGLTSGIPDGWDNSEGTTTSTSYKWSYYNNDGHGDKPCLRFNSYNNYTNNTNFLKTPVMKFSEGVPMQLKFWYKNPKGGDFSVYISNDGGATYTTELVTGLTNASSWTEIIKDIPSNFVNNVVIVFKGTSNYGSGDAYIYLDDVLVKENANYAMSISGNDVVSNTIAFGEVKNASTTKTFTISNDGANALTGVSVVSSDPSIFTVSETGFDIATGATKDITVTFVKGVVGDYSETITVSQTNIDTPLTLNVTGSYATPTAAVMEVKVGENAIGESVAFGSVGKVMAKPITIANTGEADLVISSITSSNTTDFTVSPSSLTVQGGSSNTFDVIFVYNAEALNEEKTATITITPSNDGLSPVSFAVTGTRIEQWSEDFSGNALPGGWETTNSNYWTVADGVIKSKYNSYNRNDYLYTPSLIVSSTSESLTFDYVTTAGSVSIPIYYSKDGGDYTAYAGTPSSLSNGVNGTFTITGLEAGNYKFRFGNDDYNLDNFEGFRRNMNDPKLGVYSDAGCTTAVATSVTKDLGFASDTQTANYYIKNDGTGTMTLSLGENPEGITASLDKTSVAAGEHATLTITMDAANKGYNGGNVVVTATDLGTFTVAVSGVIVEEGKLNLNFATDDIPATWTAGNWSKNANGYVGVGYSGTPQTMLTSNLNAEAGENLVVIARQEYTSSTYSFGVKYKKIDAEEWSDLIPATNIGTNYVTLHGIISEAGTYQLQFNGQYTQIQRIYGLTEPMEAVMVVYDGENKAGDSYSFGKVTDETVATHTFTVKNEGKADMTGLTATLSDDNTNAYNVTVSTESVAVGKSATVTVTQLTNIGDHTATLTISADGLESKVIALSGKTVDHTALDVDFANNEWPAGWQHDTNWSVYGEYAYNNNTSTASSIITTPLTISDSSNKLTFEARKDQSSGSNQSLVVRYSTDGGITWTPYNWDTTSAEPVEDLKSQLNTSFKSFEITGINAEKVAFDFYGKSVRIDNIAGDYKVTSAPLMAFATVSDGISGANLKADGTAVYTLANNGNAAYVGTVALNGVTAEVTGEDVTYAENTLTIPVGKTATITVTMAYAAPFGEKTGSLAITSSDWVGDINVNYTADAVDPTEFVEDFEEGKPAGWYLDTWSVTGGEARIYTGVAKAMITEKVGAESGKSTLSFDAKVASGTDEQTLSVSTSTDRKTWSDAQNFTLTGVSQNFNITLAEGNEYYVKFEAANATVDNIKGVKKLTAPATDLYLVSSSMPTENVTPGSTYTATVNVASLIATETVNAELYFGENKIAEKTQEVGSNSTAITLTCNAPAAGTYDVYAKVLVGSTTVQTEPVQVVVADTRILTITNFTRTSDANVQADENNEFTATFNVTVQNTGTATLAPNDVKVTLTVGTDAYDFTSESTEDLAPNATTTLNLSVKLSAGEGGNFTFKVKENVSNTEYFTSQSVAVTPYATLALNETETYAATDASFGKVTLIRPFIAGWNTLVLPFDIDATTFASKFGADAALYVFTSNSEGELQFTKTTEGVKAGTPYLLSLGAAITDEMTFTDVNVQPGTTAYMHNANNSGAWFYGNYTNGFDMEGKYGITPAGKVQMGGSNSTMKAFRAYITMPKGQEARLAIFDEATGISRVLTTKEVEDMNIFNLKGQRVNENAKGLIIVNGKKVVVK